jgi:CBS domain-containing protein
MKTSTVKDLMVPLSEYATVYEDATLLEAVMALEEAQIAFDQKRYRHRAILVLDKDDHVVGKLSQHDVIQALEPNYQKLEKEGQKSLSRFGLSDFFVKNALEEYRLWEKPIENLCKKAADQQVKHIMYTPKEEEYIEIDATMDHAIHRLIIGRHHSLVVMQRGKIVGILRLTDVFETVHNALMNC